MTSQVNNPLHGVTLKQLVTDLVDHLGFEEMGRIVDIRCFTHDPSINSSLKFLRKTQWARDKVEGLYLEHQRAIEQKKQIYTQTKDD
ncbi:VF530 family protein [Pseudomonas sp. HK3]